MDWLSRGLVISCGFGLLVTAGGCRSTRSEVPPGRPFANDGKPRKAIEFSTDPHPVDGSSMSNVMPYNPNGSGIGATRPNASAYGVPPGGYGPPGTSGMTPPQAGNDTPSGNVPATSPDLNLPPPMTDQAAPNPLPQSPPEKGVMGTPDQVASPM